MAAQSPPPLAGIRVLEFAGLAPSPFAGLLLSDYGASVLRVDRPTPTAHSSSLPTPPPTPDLLTRRKTSIALDLKSPGSRSLFLALLPSIDVLIDPFRPGVLERLGLPPTLLLTHNPRLILARMTGFRRTGKYAAMAGHDINYLAVSGILSMLGPKAPGLPLPPGNILADFAGGGAMCFLGILLALFSRERTGKGQVVEANMVDGAAYLGTMPRLGLKSEIWRRERGTNTLDGGCPYYGTYACKDGGVMSVGALEPQFFALLLRGLGLSDKDILVEGNGGREDRRNWPHMKRVFTETFLRKRRAEWEDVFDGTDACVAPVLAFAELEAAGYEQKVPVDLVGSPGLPVESADGGWSARGLGAGVGGEETLRAWVGWERGVEYGVEGGALVWNSRDGKAKL